MIRRASSVIGFPQFVNSIGSTLNVGAVYNIDPKPAVSAPMPNGGVRKQYLSGMTGVSSKAGFESMSKERWRYGLAAFAALISPVN